MICQESNVDLETVVLRIKEGDINLQPDFQRGEVWSDLKKKKLIDTILRGWKVPPIHMIVGNNEEIEEVLDGQQRLASIRDFYNNVFPIDGNIQPHDEKIHSLDKCYYKDLPIEIKRLFRRYVISIIRLSDYKAEEPAELFYRLNQPATLTAAEQRNAYIGNTRAQIKELVKQFEAEGANKETIGFSNSRLAYDEIISKFAYMVEAGTLKKKVTAGDISKRYREDTPFNENTIRIVNEVLHKYINVIELHFSGQSIYHPKLSKATLISWLIFIKSNFNISIERTEELIFRFESSRDFLKSKLEDNVIDGIGEFVTETIRTYPFFDAMLNVYNQRASMASTDASSIIYRDIIINIFYSMLVDEKSPLLEEVIALYSNEYSMNYILETVSTNYSWGEVF